MFLLPLTDIFKCTQKRPNQRYSSCADLIRSLRHALVAPNERFVHFVQLEETANGETTVMSDEQMRDIRNRSDRGQHENTAYQERSLKSQQIKRSPARESAAAQQRRHEQIDFETYVREIRTTIFQVKLIKEKSILVLKK